MERYTAYGRQHPLLDISGEGLDGLLLREHARYELVSSNFLYHRYGWQYTRNRLRALRKGAYIGLPDMPIEERKLRIPRNGFYPTTMKARGAALYSEPHRDNDQFPHKLLRCKIEWLLDDGPFITKMPEDILAHPNCPPETREAKSPFSIPLKPKLKPDITRGFSDGDNTIFVHTEVDRSTERMSAADDATSLEDKIIRYVEYLNRGLWQTHFGFAVPPSVLLLTTRQNTAVLKALVKEHAKDWYDRIWWLSIPKSPLPTDNLFVPWQGVDGTLDLTEVLNVVEEQARPRQSA